MKRKIMSAVLALGMIASFAGTALASTAAADEIVVEPMEAIEYVQTEDDAKTIQAMPRTGARTTIRAGVNMRNTPCGSAIDYLTKGTVVMPSWEHVFGSDGRMWVQVQRFDNATYSCYGPSGYIPVSYLN